MPPPEKPQIKLPALKSRNFNCTVWKAANLVAAPWETGNKMLPPENTQIQMPPPENTQIQMRPPGNPEIQMPSPESPIMELPRHEKPLLCDVIFGLYLLPIYTLRFDLTPNHDTYFLARLLVNSIWPNPTETAEFHVPGWISLSWVRIRGSNIKLAPEVQIWIRTRFGV